MSDLLTVDEAASRLRVSIRTVWRLIHDGRIRPVRIGSRTLVTAKELDAFVASLQRRGAA